MAPSLTDPLAGFTPVAAAWFCARFGSPSPPQALGWPQIAAGRHVLITAPTGSGKTLAAFFKCLDVLWQDGLAGRGLNGVQVLYVSPLKALGYDIERNLQEPLAGVSAAARDSGVCLPSLQVGVRTGDTAPAERARQVRRPPEVLITTPESLYLLLTGRRARQILSTVRYVIVDEIHALLDSKRGAHLALSLERLEELTATSPLRIGLTATVRPLQRAARFLGGQDAAGKPRPVAIADAGLRKQLDLSVEAPVAEMSDLPDDSIWPAIHTRLLELVAAHRSTLVFVNFRRSAERLAARLNELAGREVALCHHGSLAREQRRQVEERLKRGELPCLVATSSLELGIDMGAIDLVVQVESPKGVGRGLQRVGRAGHLLGATARGRILPKYRPDLLEAAAVARGMLQGRVEAAVVPENCLDVLAQQVAAAVAMDDRTTADLLALARRAYPYRRLSRRQLEGVLGMLAGRYAAAGLTDLRPRIVWTEATDQIRARPGLGMLAVRSGGTIPDRGLFGVFLEGSDVRLGEVDEEFGYESRPGDTFVLGTATWRVVRISHDRVEVAPAPGALAKMPFWHGDALGRPYELGRAVGRLAREVAARLDDPELTEWLQDECALAPGAAANLRAWLWQQQEHLGQVPTDRRLVAEWFRDEVGSLRIIVHSPFGSPVHAAWGLILKRRLQGAVGAAVQATWGDDGILLRLPPLAENPPLAALQDISPAEAEELLLAELGGSAVLGAHFRMAAERALLLPRHGGQRRTPLWLQRLKAKDLLQAVAGHSDFPILLEAYRDVLQSRFDLGGLREVLTQLDRGELQLTPVATQGPSPGAAGLIFAFTMGHLYDDDTPRAERASATLALERGLLLELLGSRAGLRRLLDRRALAEVEAQLQRTAPDRRARSADAVADLLERLGDLAPAELAERCAADPGPWLGRLQAAGRAVCLPVGAERRWVAAAEAELYSGLPGAAAAATVLRRFARTRGPFTLHAAADRYGLPPEQVLQVLRQMEAEGILAAGGFRPGGRSEEWCDLGVLDRIRRRTLALARQEVEPCQAADYACFLGPWQGALPAPGPAAGGAAGPPAVLRALALLQGLYLPAALWEAEVLPRRVPGYQPVWLDQLLTAGEVVWAGQGGKVAFFTAADLPALVAGVALPVPPGGAAARQVLQVLQDRGAAFLGPLAQQAGLGSAAALAGLWELVWAGWATNDTFAPVRAAPAAGGPGRRAPPTGAGRSRHQTEATVARALAGGTGRWSLLPWTVEQAGAAPHDETVAVWARVLLGRYGFVGREMAAAEPAAPAWGDLLRVLRRWEMQGRVQQGYFITGLAGQQFAQPAAVERLRAARRAAPAWQLIPAAEPGNPYGPLLPLPATQARWRLARVPGSYLVLHGGRPRLAIEGHGRRLVPLDDLGAVELQSAVNCLAGSLSVRRRPRRVAVEWWGDQPVSDSPAAAALLAAGFERGHRRFTLHRRLAP